MCSYKLVRVKFEVFGLQTKVETSVHKVSSIQVDTVFDNILSNNFIVSGWETMFHSGCQSRLNKNVK
jgi:hypothetical protein